jgi:streptomycin 3"-adenylyltransferase
VDREIVAVGERLGDVVQQFAPLVGAYVHGSATLGGFVAGRSDVDLLIVVEHEPDDVPGLGDRLVTAASPSPGRGVELSVVTREQAAAARGPWPFVLHVVTDPADAKVVLGSRVGGDPDLLMHYAVIRSAGATITGPVPGDVFGEPRREAVNVYLAGELEWATTTATVTEAYAVLNACRAWQYVETGELVSKVTGGTWARERGGSVRLIGRALGAQLGLVEHRPLDDDGRQFVLGVRSRL